MLLGCISSPTTAYPSLIDSRCNLECYYAVARHGTIVLLKHDQLWPNVYPTLG